MFLILGFLMGLTAGFTVVTAQHYGAGNMKAMRQSVASAAILSAAVSLLMTVGSMAMMRHILRWMNTPADMYDQAYGYIMVICGGIAAQVLYNLLASVLRALGDSKRPLYFLILAALFNIVPIAVIEYWNAIGTPIFICHFARYRFMLQSSL